MRSFPPLPRLALCLVLSCGAAHADSFTVTDERAPVELSETSHLYIDGQLVATFVLDAHTTTLTKTIAVPVHGRDLSYALCGDITVYDAQGRKQLHEVSSRGVLHRPDGRHYTALGAEDFTDFYLIDEDDPSGASHHPGDRAACAMSTS